MKFKLIEQNNNNLEYYYNYILNTCLISNSINEPANSFWILQDGKCLWPLYKDKSKINIDSDHQSINYLLKNKYNLTDNQAEQYGTSNIANHNAIRCSYLGNSIILPKQLPTAEQFNTLELFLESMYDEQAIISIGVDNNYSVWNEYNCNKYIPDDIIKKIKRYYSSGRLYESIG